jgi:hypothetical protein
MNLIHSNREDCNEDSFDTLKDVASELNEIINLRPEELFYDTEPANHKVLVYDKAIFGREREVHQITEAAGLLLRPEERQTLKGRLVLVSGNAGEGKTCISGYVADHLFYSGWLCIKSKFYRFGSNSPFLSLASALETFFRHLIRQDNEQDYLAAFSAALQNRLPASLIVLLSRQIPSFNVRFRDILERVVSDDEDSDDDVPAVEAKDAGARNRMHYAFRNLLHIASGLGRPVVFIVEDLHWAKQASCKSQPQFFRRYGKIAQYPPHVLPQVDLLSSLLTDFDHLHFGDETSPIIYLGTYSTMKSRRTTFSSQILKNWYFQMRSISML